MQQPTSPIAEVEDSASRGIKVRLLSRTQLFCRVSTRALSGKQLQLVEILWASRNLPTDLRRAA